MAINPDNITTIRVDQLATAVLNVGNEFAHSQGSELKKATIQDLVDIVSAAVGAGTGVGFLPISVTDGQQLPSVPTDPSFFLCGPGTYLNVNGFPDIICTEELNAVMSLSDHWEIAVEIPINSNVVISQTVTEGVTNKTPSENAVFNAINEVNLNKVLTINNETSGKDILISNNDKVLLDNGANLKKGTTDAGLGGSKGIALRCAVDYELKWEAGRLYVMGGDGFTIREVSHNFTTIPDEFDDETKGFVIGSRWILDNGTVYVCTDDGVDGAVWELQSVGTVTSVGLTMPTAFSVANSPITTSGTLEVTANGSASQYIRGDGQLADFPTGGGGGGSSVSYYLNGSVTQGTFGGNVYKEMNKTPIFETGTDFTINADGYIAQFITDANDPNSLLIPAGNWNFETYFSASSAGGTPSFYVELYKYSGTTFTLIASNGVAPELISLGTSINPYFSALAVPETVLLATDRLAIRIFVTHSGRTITLHTENSHLCQVITTFSGGVTSLNGLTANTQYLAVGTSGSDFNIDSIDDTHTFNLPDASATARGALSSADWTTFNDKQDRVSGVSDTEISYLDGVTSSIQTQIDAVNVNVITITTAVSINTDTTSGAYGQHGRHNKISNGANAINIQCVSTSNADFVASYEKIGSGTITFTAGAGITLTTLSGTEAMTGVAGSKACLSRNGSIYYLQITNY